MIPVLLLAACVAGFGLIAVMTEPCPMSWTPAKANRVRAIIIAGMCAGVLTALLIVEHL